MKLKLLFVILIIISLTSCKHKDKLEFIQKYLENPEKFEEILKSSDFNTDNFRIICLPTESSSKLYINWAERFIIFKNDKESIFYEIIGYNESEIFDERKNIKEPILVIIISNKQKDFGLEFTWIGQEKGGWYLSDIRKREQPREDIFE